MKKLFSYAGYANFAVLLLGASVSAKADLREDLNYCQRTCARECRGITAEVQRKVDDISRDCGFGGPIPPPPYRGELVRLYKSDSCSSNYLGAVDYMTNCEAFAGRSDSVWGIQVGGRCYNVADMSGGAACVAFGRITPDSVLLFKSDSCNGGLVAAVDRATDCRALGAALSESVWGIQVGGNCVNIADTDLVGACERFKNER